MQKSNACLEKCVGLRKAENVGFFYQKHIFSAENTIFKKKTRGLGRFFCGGGVSCEWRPQKDDLCSNELRFFSLVFLKLSHK